MLRLLPNERWEYGVGDAIRGLTAALLHRHLDQQQTTIEVFGLGPCLSVRSARTAIVACLKALALPPRASIAVPLYCCPVVFKAIQAAGCRPRFIDVDPHTYCLSVTDLAAKSSDFDAVIAVHMFGNVCDMSLLRQAAPGKPFIEDCAQALGSRIDGRSVGSFAEFGVFSFRSGKYLSVGEGGAIYCSDAGLRTQLGRFIATLPTPTRVQECAHVATTYLRSLCRRRPLWGLVGVRVWDAYNATVSYTTRSPLVFTRGFESDRKLVVRRIPLLASWLEKQRSNAEYYSRNLTVDPGMLCSEWPGAFFNRLQYPILLHTSSECEQLSAYLRQNHVSTARPYKDIPEIAATHYGYAGDCPQAERIARAVLVIPCNYALKAADIERVASCINRVWAQSRDRRPLVCTPRGLFTGEAGNSKL